MLKQSKLVVLDEVTASVNLHTDELMQKVVRDRFADCAILAVGHRLQTIVDLDRSVVMQSGRSMEQGSPDELLAKAKANACFRVLWDA